MGPADWEFFQWCTHTQLSLRPLLRDKDELHYALLEAPKVTVVFVDSTGSAYHRMEAKLH